MGLSEKQSGMRIRRTHCKVCRQPLPRVGRPCAFDTMQDPIEELRTRAAMAYLWLKRDADVGEIASKFHRPRPWVEGWLDSGLPLI